MRRVLTKGRTASVPHRVEGRSLIGNIKRSDGRQTNMDDGWGGEDGPELSESAVMWWPLGFVAGAMISAVPSFVVGNRVA